MHGRKRSTLKSDEAEAEKERQKQKLDLYRKARDELFSKIKAGFDGEAMEISKAILSSNPDFTTLWNHRRKYILGLLANDCSATNGDASEKILESELRLTQACLLKNPKSYSAWHHRYWTLSRMRSPDFSSEFALIDSGLQEDDRNFHCWDYRRLVCRLANRPLEEELSFSEKKVNDNFSNFSAWHYRSRMLSQLRPGGDEGMPIELNAFFEELSLSRNGIFTDPDDQSCWLYQNWLTTPVVGKVKLQSISIGTRSGLVVLCFNQAVTSDMFEFTLPNCQFYADAARWITPDNGVSSCLWYSRLSNYYPTVDFLCVVKLVGDTSSIQVRWQDTVALDDVRYWHASQCKHPVGLELPANVRTSLVENLSDVEKLIVMEPENHLALVSAVTRMDVLGRKDYTEQMIAYLDMAAALDKKRKNFYLYWRSSLLIDSAIRTHVQLSHDIQVAINLSAKGLTCLNIAPDLGFLTFLNISYNSIESVASLCRLVHLRQLLAQGNSISTMQGLENLTELEFVDLTSNCIDIDGFSQLSNCKRLTGLLLGNNPVCRVAEIAHLPYVSTSVERQVSLERTLEQLAR
uniref:Geranylgeranyl transferase type-2 subunit alpha n=1 Tax=Trichuris muris TaxID=70415 RepID=A0A5S6R434_TRIMR